MRCIRALALVAFALAATGRAGAQQTTPPIVDRSVMDTTCAACEDFYRFANGRWLDSVTIPASYAGIGSGREVFDRNQLVLRNLLESAAADRSSKPGSVTRKIGDFYSTCMDSAAAERAGATPLKAELRRIAAIRSVPMLQAEMARLNPMGVNTPIGTAAYPDFKDSRTNMLMLAQAGLGMPDRDYYTKTDAKSAQLRDTYVGHVSKTLQLLGDTPAAAGAAARRILALETAMASAQMTLEMQRDPANIYHKMSVDSLQRVAPAVQWTTFIAAVHAQPGDVNLMMPDYFKALSGLLTTTPLATWRDYLRWQLTAAASPTLSSKFVNENFAWTSKLRGTTELPPRWKRCQGATDSALGEAVGELFVARTFTPAAKARMLTLVHNLQDALRERLAALDWMSPSTKEKALAKLDAFMVKIGYPDVWRDYSNLTVDRSSYWANMSRASAFEDARNMKKAGRPVDRTEWGMTPQTVDAYNNPLFNEIVFPAGILQPPFFDPNADDAVNYGAIGAIIGHEITHGFDDEGRKFDAQGNMTDWWTPEDDKSFTDRGQRVVDEYNGYIVADTFHVNGRLTLGENIADIGGLKIAYAALQKALQGKPRPLIDGYTPEQRFFLAYARAWRNKVRPEAATTQSLTDPHSPPRWRLIGAVSNMPEFAAAFGCKPGDKMVAPPNKIAQIW